MTDIIQFSGDAVDSAAQRLGLGLGIDTFPNPADSGIGTGVGVNYPHTSLDNLTDVKTGFYGGFRGTSATIANGFPTDALSVNYTIAVVLERENTATQTITYIRENGSFANKTFRRTIYQGTIMDWVLIFNSGNSVNPLDFGLKDAVPLGPDDNLDDIVKSGFYYNVIGGNAGGNNYPVISAGSLIVVSRGINSSIQSQTFTRYGTGQSDTSWTRTYGGSWSTWRLNFDSGNSIDARKFGLGDKAVNLGGGFDVDTLSTSGFYLAFGGAHPSASIGDNPFPLSGGAYTIVCSGSGFVAGDGYRTQTATTYNTPPSKPQVRHRSMASFSDGWTEWVDVFDSANTNFNVFGGVHGNSTMGIGWAASSSVTLINLPINSTVDVSSITVTGTFVLTGANGVNVRTGIPSSDVFAHSLSSSKMCRLVINNSTGLDYKEPLELRQETADSKITVNF